MRIIVRLAVSIAVLLATMAVATPAAQAITVLICSGTTTMTYSPGVTLTPQAISSEGEESVSCTGTETLHFTSSYSLVVTASCNTLFQSGPGSQTLLWNTGETSLWEWETMFSTVLGQIVFTTTGRVTEGKFDDARLTATGTVITDPDELLACTTPTGLTQSGGPEAFKLTLP